MRHNLISLSKRENEQTVFDSTLLSESQSWHCPLGTQVTRKASFKDKKIMDLIEIVGLREAHSRTNGVSDHNYERTIFYSFFSLCNGNGLLDMAEQTGDRCTQTENNQCSFMSGNTSEVLVITEYSYSVFLLKIVLAVLLGISWRLWPCADDIQHIH